MLSPRATSVELTDVVTVVRSEEQGWAGVSRNSTLTHNTGTGSPPPHVTRETARKMGNILDFIIIK